MYVIYAAQEPVVRFLLPGSCVILNLMTRDLCEGELCGTGCSRDPGRKTCLTKQSEHRGDVSQTLMTRHPGSSTAKLNVLCRNAPQNMESKPTLIKLSDSLA